MRRSAAIARAPRARRQPSGILRARKARPHSGEPRKDRRQSAGPNARPYAQSRSYRCESLVARADHPRHGPGHDLRLDAAADVVLEGLLRGLALDLGGITGWAADHPDGSTVPLAGIWDCSHEGQKLG